ncbi:hypothetical protein WJX73_001900 [Symbiochloris irregularis]|uniref:Nonsense-mediated mRNA decay factor SMG8 n=1 Tax=Symbiochloris irregularis TaxID=706552 RepID=A0AAW1NUR2_9CHLO
MDSSCVVVGVAGPDAEETRLLVSQLTNYDVPRTSDIVPSELQSPLFAGSRSGLAAFYSIESRVLYVQLLLDFNKLDPSNLSTNDRLQQSGKDEAAREAFSLQDMLWLLLSCHVVLWLQPSTDVSPKMLPWLKGLQAVKQAAADQLMQLQPLRNVFNSVPQQQHRGSKGKQAAQHGQAQGSGTSEPVPQLALLFPSGLSAADAKTVQLQEAALDAQVRQNLSQAGLLAPPAGKPGLLFTCQHDHAVRVIPSADATLQAAFDAAYAGLRGPQSSASLSGTGATFADVRKFVTQAVASLQGTEQAKGQPTGGPAAPLLSLKAWWEQARKLRQHLEAAAALNAPASLPSGSDAQQLPAALTNLSIRKRGSGKGRPDNSSTGLKGLAAALSALDACADPEHHASTATCAEAMTRAFALYQSKVSSAYPARVHESALAAAQEVYSKDGSGPARNPHAARLRQACQAYWEDGRQQCGELSLTGNTCTLPPTKAQHKHSSGVLYWLADASGLQRRQAEDPFTLSAANSHGLDNPPAYHLTSRALTVDAQEHATALVDVTRGWVKGASQMSQLQLPPLGAESAAAAAAASSSPDTGGLSTAEFPPLLMGSAPTSKAHSKQLQAQLLEQERQEAYRAFLKDKCITIGIEYENLQGERFLWEGSS